MNTKQSFEKSKYKSIKHSSYFHVYDQLFDRFVGKKITFVEIGVLGGGSLFMWRNYFGPEARIIGVDLNPGAKKWESHGFEIYIGSQDDEKFWDEFKLNVGNVDIVLDDGGHTFSQQIITTNSLLDSINEDGILVVEDTHTSYMMGFGSKKRSFINYAFSRVHEINKRSYFLKNNDYNTGIISVQFFESIVAFNINNKISNEEVTLVTNEGIDDNAKDHRYGSSHGSKLLSSFEDFFIGRTKSSIIKQLGKYFKHLLSVLHESSSRLTEIIRK
jgi:hypothetical protein